MSELHQADPLPSSCIWVLAGHMSLLGQSLQGKDLGAAPSGFDITIAPGNSLTDSPVPPTL